MTRWQAVAKDLLVTLLGDALVIALIVLVLWWAYVLFQLAWELSELMVGLLCDGRYCWPYR